MLSTVGRAPPGPIKSESGKDQWSALRLRTYASFLVPSMIPSRFEAKGKLQLQTQSCNRSPFLSLSPHPARLGDTLFSRSWGLPLQGGPGGGISGRAKELGTS